MWICLAALKNMKPIPFAWDSKRCVSRTALVFFRASPTRKICALAVKVCVPASVEFVHIASQPVKKFLTWIISTSFLNWINYSGTFGNPSGSYLFINWSVIFLKATSQIVSLSHELHFSLSENPRVAGSYCFVIFFRNLRLEIENWTFFSCIVR